MFDPSVITEVFPPRYRRGQLYLSWTSSAATGTPFQVYVDRSLSWHGVARACWLPIPAGPTHIDIGAVSIGEELTDFTRSIGFGSGQFGVGPYALNGGVPAAVARRANLSWSGGSYLGLTLAGFHIYGEPRPGAGIDYSAILKTITAYPTGIATNGFGLGAFGSGIFGVTAGSYSWTSAPLAAGTWQFAVKPFDSAGIEGVAQLSSVLIAGPPGAPGLMAGGVSRLAYSLAGFGSGGFGVVLFGDGVFGSGGFGGGYPFGEGAITLNWNAST